MKKVKKIVIYGDSISTGSHGEGGYERYLKEALGAEIINYAIGSSGLSDTTPNNTASILKNSENIPADADLIIMWHGSNDWYWGSPMGTLADRQSDTFLGAIADAAGRIRERAKNAAFVWLTPLYRYEKPDEGQSIGKAYEIQNKLGNTLGDYYHGLQLASAYHGFYLVDMRRLTGIHEGNQELYLEDCVHPNKAGYERIQRILIKELGEILYYEGY